MGWVRKQVNEHSCKKPMIGSDQSVTPGDIWECPYESCKARYLVDYDQREGNYFRLITGVR